jgi:hypothetical protein
MQAGRNRPCPRIIRLFKVHLQELAGFFQAHGKFRPDVEMTETRKRGGAR